MQRTYPLKYHQKIELFYNYKLTEVQYMAYYQSTNDPTFENYDFKDFRVVDSEFISYYDTVIDILLAGEKLSILIWEDFVYFLSEWVLIQGWNDVETKLIKNSGISMITTMEHDCIGEIKCIWIIKKYAIHRPIGVKVIRELDYLIHKVGASKGVIVTTSRLTKEALKLINEKNFIMSYIDNSRLEKVLLKEHLESSDIFEDLPF